MDDRPLPDLRATDADRERVAEQLRLAAGEGQLDVDELDERLAAAYAARTTADLVPLTADLQESGAVAAPRGRSFAVRSGEPGGARWLVAIMSGCDRRGRWRLGPRATSLNIMGGADLDLNEVELTAPRTELSVYSVMGGADIHVPEGLDVEVSEFAFMGGNDVRLGAEPRHGGGPVLHLRLVSIMGGTNVRRGRKLSRAERKALKATRNWHGF
jgi:hypothetical protein